jgi:hypothetical protein
VWNVWRTQPGVLYYEFFWLHFFSSLKNVLGRMPW